MYADDEARLIVDTAAGDSARLNRLVARRCTGEPLELVVGFADFAGVRVSVVPGVFIPRVRSAGLVDIAVDVLNTTPGDGIVVDLGCGTGALAMALLHRRACTAYAIDNDPVAVGCAERNVGGSATVLLGDLFAPLPAGLRGRVDVVLANLPYVPAARLATLPREARLYEPTAALDGGADGLVPLRRGLEAAREWMRPNGSYLCELDAGQLATAEELAAAHDLVLQTHRASGESGVLVRLHRRGQPAGLGRATTR